MRKQGIHARLRRRRIEDKLRLPIFLLNRVVVAHHDRAVSIPLGDHPQLKKPKVHAKGQNGRPENEEQQGQKSAPQPVSKIGCSLAHEARL